MDFTSYIKNLINKKEQIKNSDDNSLINNIMKQAYPENKPNFIPVWVDNEIVSQQPIESGISKNVPVDNMQIQDTQPIQQTNDYQLTSALTTPVQPQNPQIVQSQPAQTNNGFIKGIADFAGDFQRGYNENKNNAFSPENLLNTQFIETIQPNNTKLKDYQNSLKSKVDANGNRIYSDDVVNAVADKKNSGNKDIMNWINENSDAYATSKYYDKGIGGKIGEGLGTATRFLNSPTGQALIGGAVGMMTGNPLFALTAAYNAGNLRSKNDIYNQVLKKYQIEPSTGYFYNMGEKDLNALSNADYRYNWNMNRELANAIAQQKADQQYELGKERNDISQDRVNKNYEIGKTRNGIAQQKVNISGSKTNAKAAEKTNKANASKQAYTLASMVANETDPNKKKFLMNQGYVEYGEEFAKAAKNMGINTNNKPTRTRAK